MKSIFCFLAALMFAAVVVADDAADLEKEKLEKEKAEQAEKTR